MNKRNSIKWISLIKDTQFGSNMISLKSSFELLALFHTFGFRILNAIGTLGRGYPTRLNFMLKFFRYILHLKNKNGENFVVQYLKTGQLAIQKKIAGTPVSSCRDLNPDLNLPRLINGFPYIIPVSDRRLIMRGSSSVIRYWLTLFSLYRIISIPGQLKLNTITDAFSGQDDLLGSYTDYLQGTSKSLISKIMKLPTFKQSEIFMINKASPTSSRSWQGFYYDIHLMPKQTLNALKDFLGVSEQTRLLNYINYSEVISPILESYGNFFYNLKDNVKTYVEHKDTTLNFYPVGQLATKEEAAGKVRVFAMVDYWSQISLKGLHDYIFDILKRLPNDGTFDQGASIKRAADKVKISKCSWGYDLTAATDRLPLELQIGVLASFFSWKFAYSWADLLVYKRDYVLWSKIPQGIIEDHHLYKYSVGQPMGALSSWAMLALTHHLIVQMAYKQAYVTTKSVKWFEGYELLGDDIVIFDEKVAMRYLELMEIFGVPINLSKSVISNNETVEFAKVTMHNGVDVSALSWKLFLSSSRSLMGRSNIALFLLNKGIGLNRLNQYLKGLLRKSKFTEGAFGPGYLALLTMLANKKVFSLSWLIGYINNVRVPLQSWYSCLLLGINEDHCFAILQAYFVKGIKEFILSSKLEKLRDKKEVWINMLFLKQLAMMKHKLHENSYIHDRVCEVTLCALLPNYDKIPYSIRKDLYDFFSMALCNKDVSRKIIEWYSIDIRKLKTLDEFLNAILLYQSIVAHFSSHLDPKDSFEFDKESPLKVLSYLTDLSKSVPDFVKQRQVNDWFS